MVSSCDVLALATGNLLPRTRTARSVPEGKAASRVGAGIVGGGGGKWGICPSWGNPRMTEDVDGSSHEAEGFWTPLVGRINGVGSDLDGHRLTEQSR